MTEEYPDEIKLYDHVPNSGIVHLPGRWFPAVAIQGDSLSIMFGTALSFMEHAKESDNEDLYYEALELAEKLQNHLLRYESVLANEGFEKPYMTDVKGVSLEQEFKNS